MLNNEIEILSALQLVRKLRSIHKAGNNTASLKHNCSRHPRYKLGSAEN